MNARDIINRLLTLKADLSSPAFTDIPVAPTASVGTNTTQLATTEFTKAEIVAVVSGTNVSLTTNGYQKLPSGLILQWGKTASIPISGSAVVTFPIAFPTACLIVTSSLEAVTTADSSGISQGVPTTSQVTLYSNQSVAGPHTWFAIGY